jgi:cell division protein FtsB
MLRAGQKRRRTTGEIKEEKKMALSRQAAIEAKLATMD